MYVRRKFASFDAFKHPEGTEQQNGNARSAGSSQRTLAIKRASTERKVIHIAESVLTNLYLH